jgi:hypothetical protein
METILDEQEMVEVFKQDPAKRSDGGFQGLMVKLQTQCDRSTGHITLDTEDVRRIPQYAFDYNNGGWEDRLKRAFGRHLGPKLGR